MLRLEREAKKVFDPLADNYPYTASDLKNPRFYYHCQKRIQIALGKSIESKEVKVLDVGCGTGYFTFLLSKFYEQAVGIDLSKRMMMIAKSSFKYERKKPRIELVLADSEYLPFRSDAFNAVLCLDFLHHVNDAPSVLKEMARVTIPGGKMAAIEPNFLNPLNAMFCLIVRQESLKRYWEASRGKLCRIFKEVHMNAVESKAIEFYPQIFLKLNPFPNRLWRILDYLEELLRGRPALSLLCSHFAITGKKAWK